MKNAILLSHEVQTKHNTVLDIINNICSLYGVRHISICQCGALTFEFDTGDVSVSACNAHLYFTLVPQHDFLALYQRLVPEYVACNHCANHWGLDLCKCGSGEAPNECAEGQWCCGQNSQNLEDYL